MCCHNQYMMSHNVYDVPYISLRTTARHPLWKLLDLQLHAVPSPSVGKVFPASLNVTGGWVRVANLNMTDPDQQCPGNLRLSYTNPIWLCGRRTDYGCDSVIFATHRVQYQQVCGRVRDYQFGSPDGFQYCPAPCTIDKLYVDGVSITHGASPRKHIWTYAASVAIWNPNKHIHLSMHWWWNIS